MQPKKYVRDEDLESLRQEFEAPLPTPHSFELDEQSYSRAEKRLAFLQMNTRGQKGYFRIQYNKDAEGNLQKTELKLTDPAAVADKARYSNWHGGNMDPDQVKRHQRSLSRAGFRNNSDVIGKHGF